MSWKKTIQKEEPSTKASWRDSVQSEETISEVQSGLAGAFQGASLGFNDEITGATEAALNMLGVRNTHDFSEMELGRPSLDIVENYTRGRDAKREMNEEAKAANPKSYMGGEIGGSIASGLVPGLNIAKGSSLASRTAQAAALGGTAALGMSDEDTLAGLAKDTVVGVGLGGGMNVLGEKVLAPSLRAAGSYIDDAVKSANESASGYANKVLSKGAKLFSGIDEDAALRQIQRPKQVAAAEADDFVYTLGQKAVAETQKLGQDLGSDVGKAGQMFKANYGQLTFDKAQELPAKIDDFLIANAPSQKGFSALDRNQMQELESISGILRSGNVNGEDLFKFRQHLDSVEKLAGKYDVEGTSPYVNFLKSLRHDADKIIDDFDINLDAANTNYAQFKNDTGILRSATNESQAEGMIGNLYGANKKVKQEAAERLFSHNTMASAKDIASNKAFESAKRPGGDNYFRRGAAAVITSGASEVVTSPLVWKKGLRFAGNVQEFLKNDPRRFGKYAGVLSNAMNRGNQGLASTHFILSQQDPEYREMMNKLENEGEDETD